MIPSSWAVLKLNSSYSSIIYSSIFFKFIDWVSYYIYFCKGVLFTSGLIFSYQFVYTAVLDLLTTYFTQSSEYSLRKAASFVSIREGLSASLAIVVIYISYAFLGPFKVIISSIAFYISGLVLLNLVYWEIFPESKSDLLNIIGVVLLAVGKAGACTLLGDFLADQVRSHHEFQTKRDEARIIVWEIVTWCCSASAALSLTYFCTWGIIFIISASLMGGAFIMFLFGIGSYYIREIVNDGCRFTIFRVVKASLLKRHLQYPTSKNQFFGNIGCIINDGNQLCLSPQIKSLRWVDKAAIIESTFSQEEQEKAGRLCTVTQVQGLKLLLKIVPMWTTFLAFGLVVSTGNIFFSEQGESMNFSSFLLGLFLLRSVSRQTVSYLFKLLLSRWIPKANQEPAQLARIWAGMVVSIFCCYVARQIEVRRLNIVNTEGLQDDPYATVPMNIFWLAPQFCLAGLMEGLAVDGLDDFSVDQFPDASWKDYVWAVNKLVMGIGSFLSIFSVYTYRSLFTRILNSSRLDEYYKMLTVVSFINMCYYLLIMSTFYARNHTAEVDGGSKPFVVDI